MMKNETTTRARNHLMIRLAAAISLGCLPLSALAEIHWTIQDSSGAWVPNPECAQPDCGPELPPDLPPETPTDPQRNTTDTTPLPTLKETHLGYGCYVNGKWRWHPAARLKMTPEHIAAAKAEADARRTRLGDDKRECDPWLKATILAADAKAVK